MATCADCVHVEVCSKKNLHVAVGMNITPRFKYKRIEQECDHFKDRSLFVKPPCKVGDTVYVLDCDNAVDEFFTKKKNIVEERHVWRIEIHKNNEFKIFDTPAYGEPPKKIGETMFFTKEAAEQALGVEGA